MDYASITLAGHLTADPVSRVGKDSREYATFSIAVNQRTGGQENVSYYDCIVPGFMYQGMVKAGAAKGSAISVTGMQTIRSYVDHEGRNGTSVNVKVLDWRFTGSRSRSEEQSTHSEAAESRAQMPQEPQADCQPQKSIGCMPQTGSVQPPVHVGNGDDLPV